MMVNILTYTTPHRKTYDVLCLLKALCYDDVTVWMIPMAYQKSFTPLVSHRNHKLELSSSPLAGEDDALAVQRWAEDGKTLFSYPCRKIKKYEEIEATGLFLCCGAGILPGDFIRKNTVINAHPGYIPNVRGLDAFKWAVFEGQPIGVTTHIIGEEVDAGEIIERKIIPIHPADTFHAAAQRVYETEVKMLVDAIHFVDAPHSFESGGGFPVHRRMPHEKERELYDRFERYKSRYC